MRRTRREVHSSEGDETNDERSLSSSSSSSSSSDECEGIHSSSSIDTFFLNYSASLTPNDFLCCAFLQLDHAVLMRDVCGRDWNFFGEERNKDNNNNTTGEPRVNAGMEHQELCKVSVAGDEAGQDSPKEVGLSLSSLSSMRENATELGTWSGTKDHASIARSDTPSVQQQQLSIPPMYAGTTSSHRQMYATATVEDLVRRITCGNVESHPSTGKPDLAKNKNAEFSFLLHDVISLAIQAEEKVTSLRRLVRTHANGTGRITTPSRDPIDSSVCSPSPAHAFRAVVRQWTQHLHNQEFQTNGAVARRRSMQQHKWMSHLLVDCARYAHHVIRVRETSQQNSLIGRCVSQPLYQLLPTPLLRHTSFMEETLRIMRWLKTWDHVAPAAGGDIQTTSKKAKPHAQSRLKHKKKTQVKQHNASASTQPTREDVTLPPRRRGRPPTVKQVVEPPRIPKSNVTKRNPRRGIESCVDDTSESEENVSSSTSHSSDIEQIESSSTCQSSSSSSSDAESESTSTSSNSSSQRKTSVNVRKIRQSAARQKQNAVAKTVSKNTVGRNTTKKKAKGSRTVNGKRRERKETVVSSASEESTDESDASNRRKCERPSKRDSSPCDVSSDSPSEDEAVVCVPASRVPTKQQSIGQEPDGGASLQASRISPPHSASPTTGRSDDAGAYEQDWLRELGKEDASPAADDGSTSWLASVIPTKPVRSKEEVFGSDQPVVALSASGACSDENSAHDSPLSTTSPSSPFPGLAYPASVGNATGNDDPKDGIFPGVPPTQSNAPSLSDRALCYDEFGNRFSRRLAEKEAKYRDMLAMQERERRNQKGYFGASAAVPEKSANRRKGGGLFAESHSSGMSLVKSGWNEYSSDLSGTSAWPYAGGVGGDGIDSSATDVTNIAVIGGLPGVGKTAAVYLAAHLMSFRVIEMNHSVRRTPKNIETLLAEVTQSKRLHGLQALTSRSSAESLAKLAGPGGKRPRTVEDLLEEAKESQQRAQKERRRRILMASPLAMLFKSNSSQVSSAAKTAPPTASPSSASPSVAPIVCTNDNVQPINAPIEESPSVVKPEDLVDVAPRVTPATSKPKKKGNAISANALASFFSSSSKKPSPPTPLNDPIITSTTPHRTDSGATPVAPLLAESHEVSSKPYEVDVETDSSPDSNEADGVTTECSPLTLQKTSSDDGTFVVPSKSVDEKESENVSPSKCDDCSPVAPVAGGKDAERGRTLVLFESADVVLADESARALYAAIRDLAGKSKVPILVTSCTNDAESCLRSPAQVAQFFGKKTPFTVVGNLPLHCVYLELLLIASIELGIVRTVRSEGEETGTSNQPPDTTTSLLSNLCICDHESFILIAKRLLMIVFFPEYSTSDTRVTGGETTSTPSLPFNIAARNPCVQRPLHDGDIRQWLNLLHWIMLAEFNNSHPSVSTVDKSSAPTTTLSAAGIVSEVNDGKEESHAEESRKDTAVFCHDEWIGTRLRGIESNVDAAIRSSSSDSPSTHADESQSGMDWVESCARQSCVDTWHGRAVFACEESEVADHTCSRRFHRVADCFDGDARECSAHRPAGADYFFGVTPVGSETEERKDDGNRMDALRGVFFPLQVTTVLPPSTGPRTQRKNPRGRKATKSNGTAATSSTQPVLPCVGTVVPVCAAGLDAGVDSHGEYRIMTQQQLWEYISFHWTVEGRVEVLTESPSCGPTRRERDEPSSNGNDGARTRNGVLTTRVSAKESSLSSLPSLANNARKKVHIEPQPKAASPLHPLWSTLGNANQKLPFRNATCDAPDARDADIHPGRILQAQQRVRQNEFTYWLERQRGGGMLSGCDRNSVEITGNVTGHRGVDSVHKLLASCSAPQPPSTSTSDEKVWTFLLGKPPPWALERSATQTFSGGNEEKGDFDCLALSTVRDHMMRQVAYTHAQHPEVAISRMAGSASAGPHDRDPVSLSPVEKDVLLDGGVDGVSGTPNTTLHAPPLTVAGGTKSFVTPSITRRQRQDELLMWRWRRRGKRSEILKGIVCRTASVFEDVLSFNCILTSEPPVQSAAI